MGEREKNLRPTPGTLPLAEARKPCKVCNSQTHLAAPPTRASLLPGAGSSWAQVAATGRAAAPRLSGVHVALAVGRGRVGCRRAAARRTRKGVQRAPSRLRDVLGARSSRARAAAVPLVLLLPSGGVHNRHVPGLGCASEGFGCATRPATDPRCGVTPAQGERMRARARGGALRVAKTRPVTPDTLGARVVGVLGPPAGA